MNGQFALHMEKILASKQYYKDFISGTLDRAAFKKQLLEDTDDGLPDSEWTRSRMSLMPPDELLPAKSIIDSLLQKKLIKNDGINMYENFDEIRKRIRSSYEHGEFTTYIYPEDECLMYAVAKLTQPKTAFIAGAYYGYFAVWAMDTIQKNGGMFTLSDINPAVCSLARRNFDKLGYSGNAVISCKDAEKSLSEMTLPLDMLVLDATGKGDDPRPEYRGKRIYGQLFKAAAHLLKKGTVIVIHNMEPENPDMKDLSDRLNIANAVGANYDTFNGLGVYIVT